MTHALCGIVFSFCATLLQAQTAIPNGYTKATIVLANNTTLNGYIKDNIKRSAAVNFLDADTKNKKTYDGNQINTITTDDARMICFNGDFFKIVCTGKLSFLQKLSDASGKANYNGAEPVYNNGTEGNIGDYFSYSETDKKLKLLNAKTVASFISQDLTGCTEAMELAKTINGDIAKLQKAVEIFNNYTLR